MEFQELVKNRQSCRSFNKDKPIELKTLTECIDIASLSPSACNAQPYRVDLLIGDRFTEGVKFIQDAGMNKFAIEAQAMFVISENRGTLISTVTGKIIDTDFTQIDIGIFTAHLTLALKEKGVDSCIIGWINKSKMQSFLGINKQVYLCILAGYATDNYPLREKKRKDIFVCK
ncbi:MAG: nitroreductase family protein [Clostridia bacterium]